MAKGNMAWRTCSAADFALSGDPAAAKLLKQWTWYEWYEMEPRRRGQWEKAIECTLTMIEALTERLSGGGIGVWLNLFGPFLPDGVLGAAHLLVNADDGCRFWLPSVESSVGGPGYVETAFSTEYRPQALRKLFEEHPGIPSRILPCNIRVSLSFVQEPDFMEVGRAGGTWIPRLYCGSQLPDGERLVLEKATYLILPNLDFDFCVVAARNDQAFEVENFLHGLGPPDTGADGRTESKG